MPRSSGTAQLTHGEYFFAMMPILYGAVLYVVMKDSLPQFSVHQAARATV